MQITVEVNSRLLCDDAVRSSVIANIAEAYIGNQRFHEDDFERRQPAREACDRGIRIGMALILGGTEAAEAVARAK